MRRRMEVVDPGVDLVGCSQGNCRRVMRQWWWSIVVWLWLWLWLCLWLWLWLWVLLLKWVRLSLVR